MLGACLIVVGFALFSTWAKRGGDGGEGGGGGGGGGGSGGGGEAGLPEEGEPILRAARRDLNLSYDSLGDSPLRSPEGFAQVVPRARGSSGGERGETSSSSGIAGDGNAFLLGQI